MRRPAKKRFTMKQIITHFTDDDLYKFTMCCAVIDNFPRAQVKYTFTDRDNTVYPPGFANELTRQIAALEDVVITEDDIDFMRRRCYYLPEWFFIYLKGFRFSRRWARAWQDDEGHLINVDKARGRKKSILAQRCTRKIPSGSNRRGGPSGQGIIETIHPVGIFSNRTGGIPTVAAGKKRI